jgi:hypothetical protein
LRSTSRPIFSHFLFSSIIFKQIRIIINVYFCDTCRVHDPALWGQWSVEKVCSFFILDTAAEGASLPQLLCMTSHLVFWLSLQTEQMDLNTAIVLLQSLEIFVQCQHDEFDKLEAIGAEISGTSESRQQNQRVRRRNVRMDPLDYAKTAKQATYHAPHCPWFCNCHRTQEYLLLSLHSSILIGL